MVYSPHFLQTNEEIITTKIYTVALYTLAKAVQMHSLFSFFYLKEALKTIIRFTGLPRISEPPIKLIYFF